MTGILHAFLTGQYAPHGYCLLWQPELIWTDVAADTLIALSYFSIPLALIHFVRQRKDVTFGRILWLFALFILACGMSHVMAVWNLWHGDYGVEVLVKAVTAAASLPTAFLLWRLVPVALALPAPSQLQQANLELAAMVRERDVALAGLQQEIAQREQAEQALVQARKIEAMGQLTGGIAHDFNNLLHAVTGNLDLIRRSPSDAERVARWADNAQHGVDRGTKLTSQLLAFSRTQRLELQPVDVNAVLAGMSELIEHSVGKNIGIKTDFSPGLARVTADPTQLELAVLNLAINARDAMPGGGLLSIATRRIRLSEPQDGLEPGDYVRIGVRDSGTGMTAEVAARALEPFFTTKEVGSGTGLGLSMAFGFAKQSGGTLDIATAPGRGTTVSILLRCMESAPPPAAPRLAADPEEDGLGVAREGVKVMVIDDDDDVRSVITETLRSYGFACHPFSSGAAAIASVVEIEPRLAVIDFAMPDMNGAEVALRLRRDWPAIRIVFVSGYANSSLLDAVVDDETPLLRKPFQGVELRKLIDLALAATG